MKIVLNLIESSKKIQALDREVAQKTQLAEAQSQYAGSQEVLKSSSLTQREAKRKLEDDQFTDVQSEIAILQFSSQSSTERALMIPEILSRILGNLINSNPAVLDADSPIDFAKTDSTKFSMSQPKLLQALYVNKFWNQIATPLMYKNSRLGSARACEALNRTLRTQSIVGHRYGELIEAFVIILPHVHHDTENWNINQLVTTIARSCPKLRMLNLADCKKVTDACIIEVAQNCKQLAYLNLNQCAKISSAAIEELALAAPPLRSLHLCRPLVEAQEPLLDASIAKLIAASPKLSALRLRSCTKVSDLAVEQIARNCPGMKALDLSWCGRITDYSMSMLGENCRQLRSLAVNGCRQLTDQSLKSLLRESGNLRSVSLAHLPFATDVVLTAMAPSLRNLKILSLNGCAEVTDSSVVAIANACKGLESLSLFSINIGDASMIAITQNCRQLLSFSISRCERVSDVGASLIQNLHNLTSLYLNTRSISDAAVNSISRGCHNIRALSLNDCVHVTSEGITAITSSNLGLISLSIDKTQITIDGLRLLSQSDRLREISAKECERLTDESALKEIQNNGKMSISVSTQAALQRLAAVRVFNDHVNAGAAVAAE